VAVKDVEQSDCCLDTSTLWQRSLPLPETTNEGWRLHPVDMQVSEEKHLALPVAGRTLQKHSPLQCPQQPGVPLQVQHGLKVPAKRNRRRSVVEMKVAFRLHHCSDAPQRLERRRKIVCRSVHWTAAAVAAEWEWRRPGLAHQYKWALVCLPELCPPGLRQIPHCHVASAAPAALHQSQR